MQTAQSRTRGPEAIRFGKGHGTGNDFVIVPDLDDTLSLDAGLVAALCDRRRGIGGDGLLRVVRSADGGWFMDYRNADGSVAEMCGNGVRVYARYLVDIGLAPAGRIPIMTRAGAVVAVVGPEAIAVSLQMPKVYAESTAIVAGRSFAGVAVDCGNPHLVCAVDDVSTLDLSRPPTVDASLFPHGVNVEFYQPGAGPGSVRMRVHERGVGETLSCGSGACAVAYVARGGSAGSAVVDVPGGRLTVRLDGETCWLEGPAVIVAHGTVRTVDQGV